MSKSLYIGKTLSGLAPVLQKELLDLGIEKVEEGFRSVSFEADQLQIYKANVWSRTAIRFLKVIKQSKVTDEKSLYNFISGIDWKEYMDANGTLAIDTVLVKSTFTNSLFISQLAKDAVVDQFRNNGGVRPSVDLDRPDLRIHIHISEEDCTVALDSSGESLHKRGYRVYGNEAPLGESLAAGMLMLNNYTGDKPFVDFMCGSGTILIEAALIANNIPPGVFRQEFGFERWKDFDKSLLSSVFEEAKKMRRNNTMPIIGGDITSRSVQIAKENIESAQLDGQIEIFKSDFEDLQPPEAPGLLIINPPYGERIKLDDLNGLYKRIGDVLKKKYSGYTASILTSNVEAAKFIGLKPKSKLTLFNGRFECKFLTYELYSGSKKAKFQDNH